MAASIQTWTLATLKAHILGELNQDRNAAGGSVPDRLGDIVHESFQELWYEHDWLYKRTIGSLVTVADTATVDLPDDFEKLDQKWLHENNRNGPLVFTDEAQPFEDQRYVDIDRTGLPRVARIAPDTTETTKYVWQVEFTPTPLKVLTYRYIYLRHAIALDGDTAVLWPNAFHRGWHFLALARCQRAFKRDDSWQETFAAYNHWLTRAKQQNDETLRASTPVIRDGNGYFRDLQSSNMYRWY